MTHLKSIHGTGIIANIYHKNQQNVGKYTIYMDGIVMSYEQLGVSKAECHTHPETNSSPLNIGHPQRYRFKTLPFGIGGSKESEGGIKFRSETTS